MSLQKNEIPTEIFSQKDRLEVIFKAHLRLDQVTTESEIFEIIESTFSALGLRSQRHEKSEILHLKIL